MPFEDESFDGHIEVICHAPELEDVYREIFRVLKPRSMYMSYEWVTTDLYHAQNPKHVDIIQGIERGNALPGLRSYTDIAEANKKVGFEVVKEKDLAKPPSNPWWSRALGYKREDSIYGGGICWCWCSKCLELWLKVQLMFKKCCYKRCLILQRVAKPESFLRCI